MARAIVLLFDSFGVGAADDAEKYGDQGANTLSHIAEQCSPHLPNLTRLGLNGAGRTSTGVDVPGLDASVEIQAKYGCAQELSFGKDTPSGHWEIAGVPVLFDWGYFPPEYPSFPQELLDAFIEQGKLPGVLGNRHASGTQIIDELGLEHMATGKPIVYTSADSVFQIAAHEQTFGLPRLYELSDIARKLVDDYNIGRVIARPFIGTEPGNFQRTANRRDISVAPPAPTLFDHVIDAGREVIAIGKTADIFAHQGISHTIKADGNLALFDATVEAMREHPDAALIFTNFVDFDSKFGHRRNVQGYADALAALDARLPELERLMTDNDIAIITADHGCDPTWPGSDHTREHIPVMVFGPKVAPGPIGKRETFADIGQSIATHLQVTPLKTGSSFL